jgi:MSHA biogenesis protein MshI
MSGVNAVTSAPGDRAPKGAAFSLRWTLPIKWWGRSKRNGLVGLASGEHAAIAVIDRSRGARPRLLACRYLPEATAESRDLRSEMHGLRLAKSPCVGLVSGEDYQLLLVEAPRVEPSELRTAVRWRIKDLIDYHIDDAVLDVFEISGQRQAAQGNVMMYAVVARAATVRKQVEQIERSDLKPMAIDIPEMALRNIAALAPEDATGAVLLYLGEHSGLITVSRGGSLFLARRIEVGSAALREQPNADHPLADNEDGFGDPLDMALDGLIDRIVLEIQRSVDYYDRHFNQPPLSCVLVAPTGPGLGGLESRLRRVLGLAVKRLDLNNLLDTEAPLDESTQAECLLAIGAALRHDEAVL